MKTVMILFVVSLFQLTNIQATETTAASSWGTACVSCHYKMIQINEGKRSIDNVRSRWCDKSIDELKAYEAAFIKEANEKGAKAKCRWVGKRK